MTLARARRTGGTMLVQSSCHRHHAPGVGQGGHSGSCRASGANVRHATRRQSFHSSPQAVERHRCSHRQRKRHSSMKYRSSDREYAVWEVSEREQGLDLFWFSTYSPYVLEANPTKIDCGLKMIPYANQSKGHCRRKLGPVDENAPGFEDERTNTVDQTQSPNHTSFAVSQINLTPLKLTITLDASF